MSAITYIRLESSLGIWKIAASVKNSPSDVRPNIVITSVEGMLGIGDLSEDPTPRSYSDGSVYNPYATREGINFSIPMDFYAEDSTQLYTTFLDFRDFLAFSSTVILTIYGAGPQRSYNCQVQTLTPPSAVRNTVISAELILVSREAV